MQEDFLQRSLLDAPIANPERGLVAFQSFEHRRELDLIAGDAFVSRAKTCQVYTSVSQDGMMKRRENLPPGKSHDHATARHEPASQPVRQANKTRAPMPYFREAHTTPHNRIGTDQVTLQLEFGAAVDCLSDPVHRSILPQTPPLVSGSARFSSRLGCRPTAGRASRSSASTFPAIAMEVSV